MVALLIKSTSSSVGLSLERVRGPLDGVNNTAESFSGLNNSRQIFVLNELSVLKSFSFSISKGLYFIPFVFPFGDVQTAITVINDTARFSGAQETGTKSGLGDEKRRWGAGSNFPVTDPSPAPFAPRCSRRPEFP